MKRFVLNYRDCLHTELKRRVQNNPAYSLRAFAKALRIEPGALSQFLSGKRIPSHKLALRILGKLALSPDERSALIASLARHQRSRGLKRISPAFRKPELEPDLPPKRELSIDLFQIIAEWYHYAVMLLAVLAGVAGRVSALPAYAAGGESHGGQVVMCPGKAPVMLDYYHATLPTETGGAPQLVDLSKMTSDDVLAFVQSRFLASLVPYQEALQLLGPVDTWLESTLQPVPDSDAAFTLPPGCVLQQVAARQDSTVYVDPSVVAELSPAQQGILMVHEALYYIAQQNGLDSSVEVRMVIRELLLQNEDLAGLSKAVHEMGSKFFWWENILGAYGGIAGAPGGGSNRTVYLGLSFNPMTDGDQMEYVIDVWSDPHAKPDSYPGEFNCAFSSVQCQSADGLCRLKYAIGGGFELSCPSLGIDTVMSHSTPTPSPVPGAKN